MRSIHSLHVAQSISSRQHVKWILLGLSQDQILQVCSRAFLNPPHVFLRDYLGIDPTQAAFTFADHGFDWIGVDSHHFLISISLLVTA